ncbi:MAG: 3-keto-5-aminohexanoate cleavage enzyme [Flavobacteriales bacterium]|jgi:3-keto-5-aminohexanoate cleavage enzyme
MSTPAIITCALTGVLTDPTRHPVPVTPEEMAAEAKRAFEAGAAIMHVHFRRQEAGLGHLPSWEPEVAAEICEAIRAACPGVLLNATTGLLGDDISGPLACLDAVKPEMAAMNAGSLNYLRTKRDGSWAWPPMLFDNSVPKIERFAQHMRAAGIVPECECFDTGIVRSVGLMCGAGVLDSPPFISFVMGVASGMPAKPAWLPLLVDELPEGARWQTIAIGRAEVWDLHRACARLGGNLRTGVEDTFYLPGGERTTGNGPLIEALVKIAREEGREPATTEQARAALGAVT